jgi:hypothetical protein
MSTHLVENLLGLLGRIIYDLNMFSHMLNATANLHLMNGWIEILSKDEDPYVRRILSRMNLIGAKIRKPKWARRTLPGWQLASKTGRRWRQCACERAVIARTLITPMD